MRACNGDYEMPRRIYYSDTVTDRIPDINLFIVHQRTAG